MGPHPTVVPSGMVEQATERRLAGDWRGACAAARVDVDFDLVAVRLAHGDEVADRVTDDLRHLVPDLLRWHLPRRAGDGLLRTGLCFPLALHPRGYALSARTPAVDGRPQRIALRFTRLQDVPAWARDDSLLYLREHWDARLTGDLMARCGGVTRLPFFTADGRALPDGAPAGTDPESLVERLIRLDDSGRHADAWTSAGIELQVLLFDPVWGRDRIDPAAFDARLPTGERDRVRREVVDRSLAWLRPLHTTLVDAARRLRAGPLPVDDWSGCLRIDLRGRCIVLDRLESPRPRARLVGRVPYEQVDAARWRTEAAAFRVGLPRVPRLPHVLVRRPPVLAALLAGRLRPDDLHPAVRAALFPGWSATPPAALPALRERIRVECDQATHEVLMRDGAVVVSHPPATTRRERVIAALGGPVQGCVAAHDGWRDPTVRMPRRMRGLRADLLNLVAHGDSWAVAEALDRGLDPHVRDPRGRTLLHLLPWLSDVDLLPRLLAAGLDVDARDAWGETPLHSAVEHGSPDLVRALLADGADRHARSRLPYPRVATSTIRADLHFLWRGH